MLARACQRSTSRKTSVSVRELVSKQKERSHSTAPFSFCRINTHAARTGKACPFDHLSLNPGPVVLITIPLRRFTPVRQLFDVITKHARHNRYPEYRREERRHRNKLRFRAIDGYSGDFKAFAEMIPTLITQAVPQ